MEWLGGGAGELGCEAPAPRRRTQSRANATGITYVAFTATPKAKTLELFGRRPTPDQPAGPGNLPAPFHVYSMRQAIEEAGAGAVQDKLKALLSVIVAKVNDLFDGELTDDDKLVYVNNVLKGKLLESEVLMQQAMNNTRSQFSQSPDLDTELMNAIMDAFAANTTMSTQALNSTQIQGGLKDILLGPAQLYEALRMRGGSRPSHPANNAL